MKKSVKIILLVLLLVVLGFAVFEFLHWPVHSGSQAADSYETMCRKVTQRTDLFVPPQDILPLEDVEYRLELDGPYRISKVHGYTMRGQLNCEGTALSAEIWAIEDCCAVEQQNWPEPLTYDQELPIYFWQEDGQCMLWVFVHGQVYHIQLFADSDAAMAAMEPQLQQLLLEAAHRLIVGAA